MGSALPLGDDLESGQFKTFRAHLDAVMGRRLSLGIVFGLIVLLVLSFPPPGASAAHSPPSVASSAPSLATPASPSALSPASLPTPLAAPPNPFSTGMPISLALGAPSLTGSYSTLGPVNDSAFQASPEYATEDASGDVWVPDFAGNRVLEFPAPVSTGEAASVVIGQSSFGRSQPGTSDTNLTNPAALTLDSQGDLWVADWGNQRVLEFTPPFTTGMAASLVLGQSDFSGNELGTSDVNVSYPTGLAFDPSGDLWVADQGNDRVLEFVPPFSSGMAASLVLGQTSFTGNQGGTTDVNLSSPIDVAATGSTVWVADWANNRVVGFASSFATGEAASYLIGQSSFTTTSSTGPGATVDPYSVSVDPRGNLWVSDSGDNRVVEFLPPFSTFKDPAVALGQSDLTGNQAGLSAVNLSTPFGAEVGPNGGLWVSDLGNNRVVEYLPTTYTLTVSETGLPAGTSWSAKLNNVTMTGTGPLQFTDINGTYPLYIPPIAGYTADPAYSQVPLNGTTAVTIAFSAAAPNPYSSGLPATVVLGEPGFYSGALPTAANASNLGGNNYAAAFDSSGDLWVTDWTFDRVLEYVPPFSNGMAASLVLGQSSFTGTFPGTSATNLSRPDGIAFDAQGDLWVSDFGNNRVLEFVPPFTTGEAASVVLGQSSFTGHLGSATATNLTEPAGLGFSGGTLWVADYDNNRVVGYPAPQTTGEAATLVLGQSDLTGYLPALSATNLSDPAWVTFDSRGNAWIADYGNDRALEFPAPLSTGEAATLVLGQENFTLDNATGPNALSGPNGVLVDSAGNVWVADSGDNRVVEFLGPTFTSFQAPVLALGQGNTSTTFASLGPSGLNYPAAVLQDPHGNLWVCDLGNNRVLGYIPSQYTLRFTVNGLPTSTAWALVLDGVTHSGLSGPAGFSEENGSYSWSVPTVSGYLLTPNSGTTTVNGGDVTVALTVTQVTYHVTFQAVGLNATASWSVTIGSSTLTGVGSGSIVFNLPNGSYTYTVGSISGYTISNGTGPLQIQGAGQTVTVTFHANGSGGSSPLGLSTILIIAIVVLVVAAVLAVLLMRRRRKAGPPPPVQWSPPSAGTPTPPPGAVAPPAPPPSGGGPPPGAMR